MPDVAPYTKNKHGSVEYSGGRINARRIESKRTELEVIEAAEITHSHHDHLGPHQPLGLVASAGKVPFCDGEQCDPRKDTEDSRKIRNSGETAFTKDMTNYVNRHIRNGRVFC